MSKMLRIFNPLSWFFADKSDKNSQDDKELTETIEFDTEYLELYIKLLTGKLCFSTFIFYLIFYCAVIFVVIS